MLVTFPRPQSHPRTRGQPSAAAGTRASAQVCHLRRLWVTAPLAAPQLPSWSFENVRVPSARSGVRVK